MGLGGTGPPRLTGGPPNQINGRKKQTCLNLKKCLPVIVFSHTVACMYFLEYILNLKLFTVATRVYLCVCLSLKKKPRPIQLFLGSPKNYVLNPPLLTSIYECLQKYTVYKYPNI